MRSRVLLGVGAWLLGATSATAGSLYAVGELDNSLLAAPTKQMSVAMVKVDLANESAQRANPLPAAAVPSGLRPHLTMPVTGPASSSRSAGLPSSSAGVLLTSPDGGAGAVCGHAGAYLTYWTPQPGFEVDDVRRGPAPVASVLFSDGNGGILMRVTCQGSVPVKRLSDVSWGGGHWRHDE